MANSTALAACSSSQIEWGENWKWQQMELKRTNKKTHSNWISNEWKQWRKCDIFKCWFFARSLSLPLTMFVLRSVSISSWLQTVASFQPIYYLWQTVNLVLLTLNAHGWWSARSSPCTLSESMRHTEDITQSIQQASTQCHSQCQKIYVQTKYF